MKIAETVTFGGSALDRAAELRTDIAAVESEPDARVILLWQGKPASIGDQLLRLPIDHPVMAAAFPDRILLGRDDDGPVLAADMSGWIPDTDDPEHLDSFMDLTEQYHPAMPEGAVFAELRGIMTRLSSRDAELAATAKAVMGWHDTHRFCARCGQESVMAMAGWQRDCPACGHHHFPRTDPVVIMLLTHGN